MLLAAEFLSSLGVMILDIGVGSLQTAATPVSRLSLVKGAQRTVNYGVRPIGAASGLLGTYAEIQNKAVMLLGEATTVYDGLSTALDQVASAYELSDADAAIKLKGVWDVRE